MTIVGTRPEIIRLAPTIKRFQECADHVLVHTGQNFDRELNEVFFEELGLDAPDHFLNIDTTSLGTALGSVLSRVEPVLKSESPDAVVILGDTNSAIAAVIARRLKFPVYHMEAGNRSFDENVPEEVNRRLVDHVSDYNLVYTEFARRNLLAEGIHPSRILLTGSPLNELLRTYQGEIDASQALSTLDLEPQKYVLVSAHREENVDDPERLRSLVEAIDAVSSDYGVRALVSTHPRTRNRLGALDLEATTKIEFHKPFGFFDYVKLQQNALIVLSDSGTISEESALLGFPAVSLRNAIERPEAIETGATITSGLSRDVVLDATRVTLAEFRTDGRPVIPDDYQITDTSRRVFNFIRSTVATHHERAGIRMAARV
jgi:UDP-N-acetylglucosamine 2-epimerase (non-hydrolysing)